MYAAGTNASPCFTYGARPLPWSGIACMHDMKALPCTELGGLQFAYSSPVTSACAFWIECRAYLRGQSAGLVMLALAHGRTDLTMPQTAGASQLI